jgi:hypothetical protein
MGPRNTASAVSATALLVVALLLTALLPGVRYCSLLLLLLSPAVLAVWEKVLSA